MTPDGVVPLPSTRPVVRRIVLVRVADAWRVAGRSPAGAETLAQHGADVGVAEHEATVQQDGRNAVHRPEQLAGRRTGSGPDDERRHPEEGRPVQLVRQLPGELRVGRCSLGSTG